MTIISAVNKIIFNQTNNGIYIFSSFFTASSRSFSIQSRNYIIKIIFNSFVVVYFFIFLNKQLMECNK